MSKVLHVNDALRCRLFFQGGIALAQSFLFFCFFSRKDGGVLKGEGFRDVFFRTLQLEHDLPISSRHLCGSSCGIFCSLCLCAPHIFSFYKNHKRLLGDSGQLPFLQGYSVWKNLVFGTSCNLNACSSF